jgi:hypothetical protein
MPTRRRALIIIAALLGLAVLSLVVALAAGSLPVTAGDILGALTSSVACAYPAPPPPLPAAGCWPWPAR